MSSEYFRPEGDVLRFVSELETPNAAGMLMLIERRKSKPIPSTKEAETRK
jgi:hypothetical protein